MFENTMCENISLRMRCNNDLNIRITFFIATLLFLLFNNSVSAQLLDRKFRTLSLDKGLSQSTVFAIRQDTLGFVWAGTQDGLNRYDSKGFKVYRPVNGNQNSLQSYYIRSLFVDHKGELWIGGNKGISRYNYAKDAFQNFKLPRSLGEWYISSITEDQNHSIWATSIVGDIFKLEAGASSFKKINLNAENNGIKRMAYVGNWKQYILLGTEVGLFKINEKNQLIKINLGIERPIINDVYLDGNTFWIATEGNGVIKYDFESENQTFFLHNVGKNSLSDNNIRCVGKDTEGNIWFGTFKGLSILDIKTGTFQNYYHEISQPYTISQNSVRSFFKDKQNGIWLGTYYGGINYYHQYDVKFNLLSQNTGKLSLNDEVVSAIKEDAKGNFWIGTNDKGLNYWNRINNTISYFSYNENNPNTLSSNNIKSIAFDHDQNLLIGTHNGGLNLFNPNTGFVKRYRHNDNDPKSVAGDLVYNILKDYKGRIWIGTRSGLDQFKQETQSFEHILLDKAGKRPGSDDITYLFEDSKHRIWIGTTNGITLFYPDSGLFGHLSDTQLNDDIINCITEDNQHRIWIGTREGLCLFEENRKSFLTYKARKDFIRGTVYGIQPDNEGNLWISTNGGLVKYNSNTKTTLTFNENDGLQNNQFNEYAFCKARDGMLLFGGIKGLSYFYPSTIKQQPLSLKLSLTGLEVFNKNVISGDSTKILATHIDQVKEIEFAPEYKQFSIFFNAFNYISANRTQYFYKLVGFDQDWQHTDGLKANYNNLKAGNYTFQVKAIGPNGEASQIRSLKIVVLSPWYNTTWFYLLLFTAFGIGTYVAYRIIAERIKALHQLKLERVDKEKVRYINQVKMDFFTNVSHELRTPLTLILAPLEELTKKPQVDKTIAKRHEMMLINAKRLYNIVDQLFEFRKTETGTRKLKVTRNDIVSFIHEIYESFKPLSEKNQINYTYHSTQAKLSFQFDKDAMEKILFNLLSNAFKYTSAHNQINLELAVNNNFAVIKVADSGIGIKNEDLSKVFDRFYQVNNQEMNLGSGVGLAFTKRLIELHHGSITVESILGKGSIFTVAIPILDVYYEKDMHSENTVYELSIVPGEKDVTNVVPIEQESILEESTQNDKKSSLLFVDDNKDILDYLRDYFQDKFDVTVAFDGKMALEILENQQFDLILSDVMMPELDGLHFCKRVKQNINTSHIPLILLTAKNETSQQIKGLEMGADDYVTKPFSTSLLEAKIVNLLRSRKRLKEFYSAGKEIIPENIAFNTLDEEFLKEAMDIIERHLSDSDFSVDKFSREIGMSRSNLYLKLKAITGESSNDFVKRIRFKKAVELMQSKRYTIAQVAYMCGFNSPSYFSTAFKQYYGVMPTEYLITKDKTMGDSDME